MSDCPACGVKAVHVGLYVPRSVASPASVIHECRNADCEVTRFNEKARAPLDQLLAEWGRLGNATLEAFP